VADGAVQPMTSSWITWRASCRLWAAQVAASGSFSRPHQGRGVPYLARSSCLSTLPAALRGSSLTITILVGFL